MKTLAISQQAVVTSPANTHPVFWRFVWKEFRMLRGFWMAVGFLAVIQQTITLVIRTPGVDVAPALFASALGAAALYAVGATAMLFAVEHEEATYDFLSSLPATWKPVFASKLLMAAVSSVALAVALSLSGRLLAGDWPAMHDVLAYVGLLGVAILEALAWGTLFSLRLKRPLVAALLAICAATLMVQLLVSLSGDSLTPSWMIDSYLTAIPWRLAVVVAVLLADVQLARHWWPVPSCGPVEGNEESPSEHAAIEPHETLAATQVTTSAIPTATGMTHPTYGSSTLRVVGRLGWQTCRSSWQMMLLMMLTTGLLSLLGLMLLPLAEFWRMPGWLFTLGMSLGGSALYGSAMFHADQQQHQYRFLAEHAGRGRMVWLCRLSVWAGGLGLLILFVWLGGWLYVVATVEEMSTDHARTYVGNSYSSYRSFEYTTQQWATYNRYVDGIGVAGFGMVAGLAIGQWSSLLMRRSLIAALMAVILATIFIGWSAVVIAWDLPWWSFLFPLPLSLLLAAWLRVPDWLTERNNFRGWSKVLAVIVLPLLFVVGRLPSARLEQVPEQGAAQQRIEGLLLQVDRSDTLEARRAGDRILLLNPHIEPIKVPTLNGADRNPTEAELSLYHRQQVEANRKFIDQAVTQTAKQECRFPMLCESGIWQGIGRDQLRELATLVRWAGDLAATQDQLDQSLDYYLASLRILTAMRAGQPSVLFFEVTGEIGQVESKIVHWAGHPDQTSTRIRQALDQLDEINPLPLNLDSEELDLAGGLLVDYRQIREVLDAEKLPLTLRSNHLAYLANKLPFEQKRAQRVLTALTVKHLDTLKLVKQRLDQQQLHQVDPTETGRTTAAPSVLISNSKQALQLRHWIQRSHRQDEYGALQLAYLTHHAPWSWLSTSYLLRNELELTRSYGTSLSSFANEQVRRLGLQVQLALVAYRMDQGQYPDQLQALVPKYLPFVPIDPFSGASLGYESAGLAYPLMEIPPQTPFVWSVGICNAVLQRFAVAPSNDEDNSTGQQDRVSTLGQFPYQYRLRPQEAPRVYNGLVFPLPK